MGTKLTLSIDGAVIRQAKAFARHRRKSLSKLVEEYLRFVSADAGHAQLPRICPISTSTDLTATVVRSS